MMVTWSPSPSVWILFILKPVYCVSGFHGQYISPVVSNRKDNGYSAVPKAEGHVHL